jgi:hypothetical protein
MREEDLPWLTQLCQRRYPAYDVEGAEAWFLNIVLKSPMMFYAVRSSSAFVITMIGVTPWHPSIFEANVIFAACEEGEVWQVLRLVRASIEWARRRRCGIWRISSDTLFDFRPIARRVGAEEISPRYTLRLEA